MTSPAMLMLMTFPPPLMPLSSLSVELRMNLGRSLPLPLGRGNGRPREPMMKRMLPRRMKG